uniref:Uncharacterized protein n=1 Tax=Panagrolaimus sp. ES5 TaxID=591445 RepID=A0AC34GCL9_9BILA
MNTMVSDYFTPEQYQILFHNLTELCMSSTNASQVMSQFVPTLMSVLTVQQKGEVAAKGLLVSSKVQGGLTTLLNNLSDALYYNLFAFCQQLIDLYPKYFSKGMAREAIVVKGFGKCNQFATQKRMTTIFCRIAKKFKPDEWTAVKKDFKMMFKFGIYNC